MVLSKLNIQKLVSQHTRGRYRFQPLWVSDNIQPKSCVPFAVSAQCRKVELNTQAGYGTIFSLVTHGFHAEAIIRLKAKYQCSTPLNGTTAEALALVGCAEFVFAPAFGYFKRPGIVE